MDFVRRTLETRLKVGHLISGEVRRADVCFRWGGDEFVLLLPELGLERAEQVSTVRTRGTRPCSMPMAGLLFTLAADVR